MMLREELRRRLLEDRGIYVTEACDKCGQLLGPVRYTRRNDSGVWCSRECRDGKEAVEQRAIRKGDRPRKYTTEAARLSSEKAQSAERQKAFRVRVQRNGKPPCTLTETKDLQAQKSPLSTIPLTPLFPALETPCSEKRVL